ncbi:hypothetical protein DRE_04661 [Drechslerella stenobrocha 248]|uniref:Rhodanese domain-containing protein n=1 Tax=Drechslerella stenobrocha 248 TaxID=1043628 RepID=W7I0S0_9PEZI|nr:hypothetical protein DRE_04661 [Drechslerella stenobrocha 248]
METDPPLKRISREELAALLLDAQKEAPQPDDQTAAAAAPAPKPTIAIIDVRDSDHVGGHIRSSIHSPSTTLGIDMDTLLPKLKSYDKVIFHCALSQQRGPSAAYKYLRTKRALEQRRRLATSAEEEELLFGSISGGKGEGAQEVYVLDGGFVKWQEKYGGDERLTEKYDAEIWKEGYDY